NSFSVAANGIPELTGPGWLLGAAGIAGGALIGRELAARVKEGPARRIILALALIGGLTTLAKGASGL
ncbi:MAG: sulfite exporter TauE/SafE family protein, partial [Kitasatospora sp.]|nr:sulfite exporter TauE/SafE family protein [Kitasatospora sp.]